VPPLHRSQLTRLLGDHAPGCVKEHDLKSYFGRKVAIDASMSIYQFLVAVRSGADNFTNADGEVTSHLMGLFYRTVRLLELGVKPAYVFDGKPPPMKGGELAKRAAAKAANAAAASKAEEEGDAELAEKYSRRVNKVTPEIIAGCKTLLRLMGVPVVNAPCEAEAQCAELCKEGLVYATATEDMDALTFGTTRLLRQLWAGATTSAEKKGTRPREFVLATALEELELTMPQFVDLCILCGCDYSDGIRGVGPATAYNLIKKHGNLQIVVEELRNKPKSTVPDDFDVAKLREMFYAPEITPAKDVILKWSPCDVEGLVKFMVNDNQFDEDKVRSGIKRMAASKNVANQGRMDSFFKPKAAPNAKDLARKRADAKAEKTVPKKRGAAASMSAAAKLKRAKK
jgi:flap endonuclease-1